MAGIDYSLEKHVVYVAATPPSGRCQSLAARQGKRSLHADRSFSLYAQEDSQFHVLEATMCANTPSSISNDLLPSPFQKAKACH